MILRIIVFLMMIVSSLTRPLFNMIDRRNQLTVCMTALKSIIPNSTDVSFKSLKNCKDVTIENIQNIQNITLVKNAKRFVKDQMNKVLPMISCVNAGVTECGVTPLENENKNEN